MTRAYTVIESETGTLLRHRAWATVRAAIRDGMLTRPETCSKCGKPGKIHAHHKDYGRPLAVRWLCLDCHRALHARIRQGIKLEPLTKAARHG